MRGVDVGDRDDLVNYATWWFEAQTHRIKVLRSRNQGLAVMK